eukprot:Lithocolla_globosa_v1_NODE_278_length_4688_cov_20.187567.p2 type:complete len:312 gc:universal NODE_278_length_4688_cov_20.187567:4266-3331(-)
MEDSNDFEDNVRSGEQSESEKDSGDETDIEQDEPGNYNWSNNGGIRFQKEKKLWVKYYKCAETACEAKKRVYYSEKESTKPCSEEVHDVHNHVPPKKLRLDPEISKNAKTLLSRGVKPGTLQQSIVVEHAKAGQEITSQNTPTKKQLKNIQTRLRTNNLPTADAISNTVSTHGSTGTGFLRYILMFPIITIILCHPECIALAEMYGSTLLIDGTFEFSEMNLILTTLMILVNGVGVPIVYVLSKGKLTEDYVDIFTFIKEKIFHNRYSPNAILTDFELAFRNALRIVWSTAMVYGDLFHLIQCCQKWLSKK